MMRGFSAAKSLIISIKLPKKFPHLFGEAALFLFSFFISFSVFNLSLSSDLFNHTNFWFFLSNTLIFIVAADSGAFSPPSTFIAAAKTDPTPPQLISNKTMLVNEPPNSPIPTQNEEETPLTTDQISNNRQKCYRRSKSEKELQRVAEKTKNITMKRSKTMIRQDRMWTKKKEEEKNELEEMTDEELNKRVEEFIERFNRQIRLQEMNEHVNENREL